MYHHILIGYNKAHATLKQQVYKKSSSDLLLLLIKKILAHDSHHQEQHEDDCALDSCFILGSFDLTILPSWEL
jgi:hypothetical protein